MESLLLVTVFIILMLVIVLLMIALMVQSKTIRAIQSDFAKERTDWINRIISKNTADYKELTKVSKMPDAPDVPKERQNPLDAQLREIGALEHGYINPYKGT